MPFRYYRSTPYSADNRGDDRGDASSLRDGSPNQEMGVSTGRELIPREDNHSLERDESSHGDVAYSTAIGDVVVEAQDRRSFPSRQRLQAANTRSLRDIESHLMHAPWWDQHAIADRELIDYYIDENGFLPDGLPGSIAESFDFTRRCLVPRSDLRARNNGHQAWLRYIRDVYARQARMPCGDSIPPDCEVDLYAYRIYGEVDYVESLVQLDVSPWRGVFGVDQKALCFARPLLRADFRYESKSGNPYWGWVKWECRMRRNDGVLVPYHCLEYQNIRVPRRTVRYRRVPPRFWEIALPSHCYVDSPPSLAYVGSKLMAPHSGWWVVYYPERTAKVACFILWDVYNRFKLWRLPKRLIQWMRSLDLAWVLGSPLNVEDLRHLLDVIEATDWTTGEVMDTQEGGGHSRPAFTDGVDGIQEMGEFVWYDPWSREHLSSTTEIDRRADANIFAKPDGHPFGYTYDPPLPPLAASRLPWAQYNIPTIPASHFYEEDDGTTVYMGAPVLSSHRRAVEGPAAKQRRITTPVARGSGTVASPAATARNALMTLARPAGVSDASLARLRDQLSEVLRQRRVAAITVPRTGERASSAGCTPLLEAEVEVEVEQLEGGNDSSPSEFAGAVGEETMAEAPTVASEPVPEGPVSS